MSPVLVRRGYTRAVQKIENLRDAYEEESNRLQDALASTQAEVESLKSVIKQLANTIADLNTDLDEAVKELSVSPAM